MNRKNIYTNIDNNYYCSYDRGEIERKRNISNSKGECDKYFRSRAQMKK